MKRNNWRQNVARTISQDAGATIVARVSSFAAIGRSIPIQALRLMGGDEWRINCLRKNNRFMASRARQFAPAPLSVSLDVLTAVGAGVFEVAHAGGLAVTTDCRSLTGSGRCAFSQQRRRKSLPEEPAIQAIYLPEAGAVLAGWARRLCRPLPPDWCVPGASAARLRVARRSVSSRCC